MQPMAIPASIAGLDRAALEERLRAAEAKLDALLPLDEKFELASGGAENEPRVRAIIDGVFAVDGSAEIPYELECRGDLCRFHTDRAAREWQEPFQADMAGLARDLMMSSEGVYFEVESPARAAGKQYVIDIADALWASPAFAACKRSVTTPGVVTVTLRVASRRVEVDVTGPLANEPIGECIRTVVEDAVRAAPLPDGVSYLPFNTLPVHVP